MILPWITVAAVPAAVYARLCRGVDIGPLLGGSS